MRYLSVCSGIEAATVAWHPLGWTPAAFSEIEAFPRAVLAHHYGQIPCHGDFTTIGADDYGPIDLLVGGTPCQSFSIAGLRGGLADDRGNLALEYLRLADRKRPRWLVWENVPGVLSIDGGRAFGAILGGLAELGYGFAYRILDAQHFGVPQRRRRVFVVGYLGDWRRAAAVLFERHSLSGHPAPRRQKGQGVAEGAAYGISPDCFDRTGEGAGGTAAERSGLGVDHELAYSLRAKRPGAVAAVGVPDIVGQAMSAKWAKGTAGPAGPAGDEHHNLIACQVAQTLRARDMSRGVDSDCTDTLIAHSLRAEGFDASEDGTGRGTPLVPVPFSIMPMNSGKDYVARETDVAQPIMAGGPVGGNQGGDFVAYAIQERAVSENIDAGPQGKGWTDEVAFTLEARNKVQAIAFDTTQITSAANYSNPKPGDPCHPLAAGAHAPAVAFQPRIGRNGRGYSEDAVPALGGADAGATSDMRPCIASASAVRRLTPVECARLQGFPDDYLDITYRGKPAADGPRYRALGNSMAVPVMSWLGERIDLVDKLHPPGRTEEGREPTTGRQHAQANDEPRHVRRAS